MKRRPATRSRDPGSVQLIHAHVARRLATAAAVLAATLGAHVAGMGADALTVRTPTMASAALAASVLVGRRRAPFRPRGTHRTLLVLVALQALAHLTLAFAPWTLGLSTHCEAPLASPPMLLCHALAAVALTLALTRLERMLAVAVAVAQAVTQGVRRLLAHRPAGSPRWGPPARRRVVPPVSALRGTPTARGPPARALT